MSEPGIGAPLFFAQDVCGGQTIRSQYLVRNYGQRRDSGSCTGSFQLRSLKAVGAPSPRVYPAGGGK
jgi:hypothetical protein